MAVEVVVDLSAKVQPSVQIERQLAEALRLANREAVNESALAITKDARRSLQAAIGAEQRLSGVPIRSTWTVVEGRRESGAANPAGIKINPAYKVAESKTKPVALIGVRGPAQYIEHPRRGGYTIAVKAGRPSRGAPAPEPLDVDEIIGRATARARSGKAKRRGALKVGTGFRYSVKGGAITTPKAPITKAFREADRTVAQLARDAFEKSLKRQMQGAPTALRRAFG